ncbi:MAG: hypothetical protein U0361_21885 [Nitrospiraceae bacterium]
MEQPEAKGGKEPSKKTTRLLVIRSVRPPQLTVPPEALEGQAFQTTVIERRPFRDEIAATATIKPNEYRLVHLGPRIEGRVIEVKAVLGRTGQVRTSLGPPGQHRAGPKEIEFLQAKTNHDVDNRNYVREEGCSKSRLPRKRNSWMPRGAMKAFAAL